MLQSFQLTMESITTEDSYQEIYKPIIDWKEAQTEDLISTLKKIKGMTFSSQQVTKARQTINQFHKQLINAGNIQEKLLDLVFQVKDYLKKYQQKVKAKPIVAPKLQKSISVSDIEVPKSYGNGLPPNRKTMLGNLYKHFLIDIKQQKSHPKLEQFLIDVENDLFKISHGSIELYNKEIKKICHHFVQQHCKTAKLRMLQGGVLAKDVALNKSEAFLSDETRKKMQQNLKQQAIFTNVDFFDEHRKKIHGGSSEQCRFCKSKNAYCWSMKQMRAADQPMTRFMKCQKCDRSWKD